MQSQSNATRLADGSPRGENTVFAVLVAISFSHLLNDTIQSLIPAIYPILKGSFHLNFAQVGLITLTFQLTASLLQPLTVIIGVVLASAFSAILVYAQELVPGKVGMIAGIFFGFAFGMAGIGSAVLGRLADHTSIEFVFRVCAFLPLLGLLTGFLPHLDRRATAV
jgi:hypothetical protein